MTTLTTACVTSDSRDPEHARGRADAYDDHQAGTPLLTLEDRLEWMSDPRTAHTVDQLTSSAYLDGYRAYIEDERATQYAESWAAHQEHTT